MPGVLQDDELQMMFLSLCETPSANIQAELSNLLDYSLKDTKKFIKELIERVQQVKNY